MGSLDIDGVSPHSTFLFKAPTWMDGAANVLDVAGQNYYCYSTSHDDLSADRRAFWHDAMAVVDDLVDSLVSSIKR